MQAPKKKTSCSKRDMRRSHHGIKAGAVSICPSCGEMCRPHHLCLSCGVYRGRQVIAKQTEKSSAA